MIDSDLQPMGLEVRSTNQPTNQVRAIVALNRRFANPSTAQQHRRAELLPSPALPRWGEAALDFVPPRVLLALGR